MNKERQHRRVWTQQQDEILRNYVEQSTDINKPKWKQISEALNNQLNLEFKRNPKQCRQRWFNSLAPTCQQAKAWGVEDDVTLIRACKKFGHRWSRLAKQFHQSVNDNRLKNHFYSTVRKIVRVINSIVKESKKEYQNNTKKGTLDVYSEQQLNILKQIAKLRTFQPKLLSKVFSLIDQKQQYRYQAKQSLQVEQLKEINNQILDYMQDYVTGNGEFTTPRILKMITRVMHVNRTIKTKYVREVKLSIQDEEQIQREQESRKKREKKINSIVKQELENKIIPDRRTKIQIINKIRDGNKKLKKLIRPIQRKRIKRSRAHRNGQAENKTQLEQQKQSQNKLQHGIELIENQDNLTNKLKDGKSKNEGDDFQNQQYDQVGAVLNFNLSNDYEGNYLKNSIIYNLGRDRLNSPGLNLSSIFNCNPVAPNGFGAGINGLSFNYGQFDKRNNLFQQQKSKSKSKQSIQESQHSHKDQNIIISQMFDENAQENDENNQKDKPFVSKFLNGIPVFAPNHSQRDNKNQIPNLPVGDIFLPELTHSQGIVTFEHSQAGEVEQPANDMYKSNPIFGSFNFLDANNQRSADEKKGFRNHRNSQGLMGSFNYSSINDKASQKSQKSQKMRCSLFDFDNLGGVFGQLPLDALYNPNQTPKENRMQASKPFSIQNVGGQKFNMQESMPICMQLYRSSDYHDSNPSGAGMYHSYSFGQASQQNKSNRSKKTKK